MLFVSFSAFSETKLQAIADTIFSEYGRPICYGNAYFWYPAGYCIMILYNEHAEMLFIAYAREDGDPLKIMEITAFLAGKGAFELIESTMDSDEYRSNGLVAFYDRKSAILFIVPESNYSKKKLLS
jgi:hypothetical protein